MDALSASPSVQGSGKSWKEDDVLTGGGYVSHMRCTAYHFLAIMPWSSCWAATKEGKVVVVIVVSNYLIFGSRKFVAPNAGGWGHQVPSLL